MRSVMPHVTRGTHAARHAFTHMRHHRASRASSPVPFPPLARAAAAALAGSPDCAHAVWRWRWRWRSVTSRATRVTHVTRVDRHARARAHHHRFARVISVFRSPRARPARARCCGGGARSIARSRAHGVALAMEVAVGHTARHARNAHTRVRHHHASRASSPPPSPMSAMRARSVCSLLTHLLLLLRTSPRRTPHVRA